ncbi:hypothetical protein [Neobacillus sp. LXY-4]|uniref:WYL domain-containing protein n=1 Tax=Neobacillus sp. LXY-4 TaxID=3379826 RepID=UPI003EE1E23D
MERLLSRSMIEKMPLEIIYIANNQQFSNRKILVNSIDKTYVYAFCYLRDQIRRFKIENILSAIPAKRLR